jgi:hypothetical protein
MNWHKNPPKPLWMPYNTLIHTKELQMKVIAHTKYGVFESIEKDATEEEFEEMDNFLKNLYISQWFTLDTDKGGIYFTKEMITDSLFILEK